MMTKKEIAYYKKKLLKEKEKLLAELHRFDKSSLHETPQEVSGDLSGYATHIADIATDNYEQEKSLNFMDNVEKVLNEVERALDKIEKKVYGKCEKCGNEISAKRLRAEPHALLCMDCKRKEEERQDLSSHLLRDRKK